MVLLAVERPFQLQAVLPAMVAEAVCHMEAAEEMWRQVGRCHAAQAQTQTLEGVAADESVERSDVEAGVVPCGHISRGHHLHKLLAPVIERHRAQTLHQRRHTGLSRRQLDEAHALPKHLVAVFGLRSLDGGGRSELGGENRVGGGVETVVGKCGGAAHIQPRRSGHHGDFESEVVGCLQS